MNTNMLRNTGSKLIGVTTLVSELKAVMLQ